jgi:spore coat polysaccharide biosynthesis protein SpsF
MTRYKTEQESFWAGEFGTEYIQRNMGSDLLASNLAFFAKALASARLRDAKGGIEFGANIGMNLKALQLLYPNMDLHAIEINSQAANELGSVIPPGNIFKTSILEFAPERTWDLVLIKGVLIHINPDCLPQVYDALYNASGRYLLVCEYYNPSPVAINYRGHSDRLFKRDFCREILNRYTNLELIDYGFAYHGDPDFPQDDITWFLMEKRD